MARRGQTARILWTASAMLLLTFLSFMLFNPFHPSLVTAESFPQTTGWRNPLITLSYNDRLSLAESALSVLARQIDYGDASTLQNGQSAVLLYSMAEYDLRSDSSVFQTNVTSALDTLANSGKFQVSAYAQLG
ncbi:hypothetical protein PENSPDRAFT_62721 [Peniophora sp. CONT]|nr:hypothetical protein PENSPDRAFT_62721 [Peniophora sp. CONT]